MSNETREPFKNEALRAISRARGHLRSAENENKRGEPVDFSTTKAALAVSQGHLKIMARIAEAHEVNTAVNALNDEKVYGDLSESDVDGAFEKIKAWMQQFVSSPLMSEEEDPS